MENEGLEPEEGCNTVMFCFVAKLYEILKLVNSNLTLYTNFFMDN